MIHHPVLAVGGESCQKFFCVGKDKLPRVLGTSYGRAMCAGIQERFVR